MSPPTLARRSNKRRFPNSGSRRRVLFEELERRYLLAVTPISVEEGAALRDTVSAIGGFGEQLENVGAFGHALPLMDASIGDQIDIGNVFQEILVTPIHQTLNAPNPTQEGLATSLNRLLSRLPSVTGTVVHSGSPSALRYTIDASFERSLDVSIDLSRHIASTSLQLEDKILEAELKLTFDFNLTFGIDRTAASASSGAFVEFADSAAENRLSAALHFDSQFEPLKANLGILGVTLGSPTASIDLMASFDTVTQRVSPVSLTNPNLNSLVNITTPGAPQNDFSLELVVGSATIQGVDNGNAKIKISDGDLFDGSGPTVSVDVGDLASFRAISPVGLLSVLNQTQSTLGGFEVFSEEIPFTKQKTLADALDITAAFRAQVIDRVTDSNQEGQPNFTSVEQFVALVADRAEFIPKTNAPDELLVDLSFDHRFDRVSFEMEFGDGLGDLRDFDLAEGTLLNVDPEFSADFQLGIKLTQPGADFGLDDNTPLSVLNAGKGVPILAGKNDFKVTLRNGQNAAIDLTNLTTVGQLKTALSTGNLSSLQVSFQTSVDPITGANYNDGIALVDPTSGPDNSRLKIEMLNGSLAAAALGLVGVGTEGIFLRSDGKIDEVKHGMMTGSLHGQSIADNIYLKQRVANSVPVPMFSGSAELTATEISGTAQLGFIDIGLGDGNQSATAQGIVTVDFTPPDPNKNGVITGREIIEVAGSTRSMIIAPKPIDLGQAVPYSSTITILFEKTDDTAETLSLPFTVPVGSTVDSVANSIRATLAASADPNAARLRVSTAMEQLTFKLTDRTEIAKIVVQGGANQSLKQLGLTKDSALYVLRPQVSGSAHFNMPYTLGLNVGGVDVPAEQRLVFDVPDVTAPDLSDRDAINLDLSGIGDHLTRLKELDAIDVFDALKGAFELLNNLEAFQNAPFLNEPLPLLGTDLKSVLNMASLFGDVIVQLEKNPAAAIGQIDDRLESLLGITNDDAVELSLDTSGAHPALRIDLLVSVGQGGFGFGTVPPIQLTSPVNIDLADLGATAFTNLIGANASAELNLQGLAELTLSIGIELPDLGAPVPFLYDYNDADDTGTNLALLVKAEATGINFDVVVGPIGASLNQQPLADEPLHKLAFGKTVGDNTEFARFAVELTDVAAGDDGRHLLSELALTGPNQLSLDDFDFTGDGDVIFNADLAFSGLPIGPYPVAFALPNINSLTDGLDAADFTFTINNQNVDTALNAVKDALAGDFDLLSFVGGWDGAFDLIIDAMEGEVFGINMPFIGDKLKDQAEFLREIKDSVSGNLGDNAENESNGVFGSIFQDIREDMLDALGPNGIDLLKDKTNDNSVTIDDVVVGLMDPGPGIEFEILLGKDLGKLELPIDFDLGIPGLGLDIDADVEANLGFEFGLSMGVDINHGFFIDTNDSFLEVFVEVAIPNLNASGELGFLRLDANLLADDGQQAQATALVGKDKAANSQLEITTVARGSTANFDVRVVGDDGQGATWAFNTSDRALTLEVGATTTAADLVGLITGTPELAAHFTASLAEENGTGDGTVDAGQRALGVANSFVAQFTVDLIDPGTGAGADGVLSFNEIISVDSFKDVLKIDVLAKASLDMHLHAGFGTTAKFPSISTEMAVDWDFQLGDDIQLPTVQFVNIQLGLGEFLSGFAGGLFEQIDKVLEPIRPVIKFLDQKLPVISELTGGDVTVLDFLKLQGGLVAQAVAFIEAVKELDNIIANIPDLGNAMLPIGNASFDPNAEEGQKFQIDGGLVDAFSAMKGAFTNAAPAGGGFDPVKFLLTEEEIAEQADDKLKLGFPILSPANILKLIGGEEVDLFTLELPTLVLESEIKKFYPLPPFPAVGIEIGGSFKAQADFAFGFDTSGVQQFQQTGNFGHIFNGFYIFDHENADGSGEDIPEVKLSAEVTAAAALNAGILKATVGGGISANVNFNLHDDDDDGKIRLVELLDNALIGPIHIFDVSGSVDAKLFATVTIDLGLFEVDKEFTIAEIELLPFNIPRPAAGAGPLAELQGSDLVLNIGPRAAKRDPTGILGIGTERAVNYRIFAGPAPGDILIESFGRSQLYQGVSRITGTGGQFDDVIIVSEDVALPVVVSGGGGNDRIVGGSGHDQLSGDAGNDSLTGGRGNDDLDGGVGNDTLYGDRGDDQLRGGDGDDKLFGGDGDDNIVAGAGNDEVKAGTGEDFVDGGLGSDLIFGEGGSDELLGGGDDDQIQGGDGGDFIAGGSGNDRLFGNGGNDLIYTGTVTKDAGGDVVSHTGTGADVVLAGVGNDTVFGDDGDDQLFGGNSRDVLWGGGGNDVLEGGLASDDLYGGLGDDRLFFNVSDPTIQDEASHLLVGGGGNDTIIAAFDTCNPAEFDCDFPQTVYGDGVNAPGVEPDSTTDGHDVIRTGVGNDIIRAGGGNDQVFASLLIDPSAADSDFVDAGRGDDRVYTGQGSDFIIGGYGNDKLFGEGGSDVIFGGLAGDFERADFDRSDAASIALNYELPPRYSDTEAIREYRTHYVPSVLVTPKIVLGLSLPGVANDGRDLIEGGDGVDILFGGSDSDTVLGGNDPDYVDAGAGHDINVNGDDGDDVVRGGGNDDVVRGGNGIDQVLGDGGDDQLFGDAGDGVNHANQLGQRLFGGPGADKLFAYAPSATTQTTVTGDQLFGDADGDTLNGNLRIELLVGGGGDDLMRGDYLKFIGGNGYAQNDEADRTGANDLMIGGGGQDAMFGGGGDDTMWGGPDGDYLDGQLGADTEYGGGGNDKFVASEMKIDVGIDAAGNPVHPGTDIIDGHFGNFPGDTSTDDSTDTLIINGSVNNDLIGLSQTIAPAGQQPQLRIDYDPGAFAGRVIFVNWLDENGNPLIETFQVAGLGGNDTIGFAGVHPTLLPLTAPTLSQPLDLSKLIARSRDWTSTLEGNSGTDTLVGSIGRDRADGGPGSDTIFGFAGDDRLIGDRGDGFSNDVDTLYAGRGNDDLRGGEGTNHLYSWSLDPSVGEFGIFVAADGKLYNDSAGGTRSKQNTGLNRMLGGIRADSLYGGTVLDFMLGRGGGDTLYRADGTTFESIGDAVPGEEWKEYAKETDQVWYVGGTNADDEISVNFVTEPGLLSDHHLITRLTENNGNFSFDAQVRLDFAATDADGNPIWSPNDLVFDYEALRRANSDAEIAGVVTDQSKTAETNLIRNLLPPEGDFLAIIIDALDGNDKITVGPTVQKSVWIDAGGGDDEVTIRSGSAILVDKSEVGRTGGLLGRNDLASQAFPIAVPTNGTRINGLTIDNPTDVDWYRVTLPSIAGTLEVQTESSIDDVSVQIFPAARADDAALSPLAKGSGLQTAEINLQTPYVNEVQSDNPLLYYRFDETGGSTAVDFSGNGANGTLAGGFAYQQPGAQPKLGSSIGFDGSTSYVDVPALGSYNTVSVEAWINSTGLATGSYTSIYSPDAFTNGDLHLSLRSDYKVDQAVSGATPTLVATPDAIQENVWYHVVTTYDAIRGESKTYINGELMVSQTRDPAPAIDLGNARIGNWENNGRFFTGRMDEFAIYRSVLSANDVSRHYAAATGELVAGDSYLVRVQTDKTPTKYQLEFIYGGAATQVDLGMRGDDDRRDIILGGPGNDKLLGGAGEDWIIGGAGADVISGGKDRLASDILLGGPGNDTFQIIPDELPSIGNGPGSLFDSVSGKLRPSANDEIDGGAGEDRMLFVGGGLDRQGLEVPDFAAIRYDRFAHRYEFSSLVWDIGQQKFIEDPDSPDRYLREYLFYQTNNVEMTQVVLQQGDDSFHADPSYMFPGSVGPEEWGIKRGNLQQGATEASLHINGGAGTDELFGGFLADTIIGGPGNDVLFGYQGNDELTGGGGSDTIFGLSGKLANGTITGASVTTPIVITTSSTTGLHDGQTVKLSGVVGNTDANGTFYLEVVSPTQFSLYTDVLLTSGQPGVTAYTSGGTWEVIPRLPDGVVANSSFAFSEAFEYELVAPFFSLPERTDRTGIDLALRLPVVHYSFDAGLGTDVSGHGNNATVVGAVTSIPDGVHGKGAQVTSTSGFLSPSTAINTASQWTISVWFKDIFAGASANQLSPQVVIAPGTNNLGSYDTSFGFHDSGFDLDLSALAGQWHQLTATGADEVTTFYLDGNQVGEIGDFQRGGDFEFLGNGFAHQLDELLIYDVALQADEVKAHYTSSRQAAPTVTDEAFGWQGTIANQQLGRVEPIGDFSGDGFDDYVFVGNDFSYVLFRPLAPNDMENIVDVAEIIIDHSALGTPGDTFGDITGNGFADLTFRKSEPGFTTFTVVNGGTTNWPRNWNSLAFLNAGNSRTFKLSDFQLSPGRAGLEETITVDTLNFDGDQYSDLLISSSDPRGAGEINSFTPPMPFDPAARSLEYQVAKGDNGFLFVLDNSNEGDIWRIDDAGNINHVINFLDQNDLHQFGGQAYSGSSNSQIIAAGNTLYVADGSKLFEIQTNASGVVTSTNGYNFSASGAAGPIYKDSLFELNGDVWVNLPTTFGSSLFKLQDWITNSSIIQSGTTNRLRVIDPVHVSSPQGDRVYFKHLDYRDTGEVAESRKAQQIWFSDGGTFRPVNAINNLPQPAVHYSFDEITNLGKDTSGNGRDAVLTNVSSETSILRGRTARFGGQDSVIRIGTSALDLGSDWTASAWVFSTVGTSDWNTLFGENGQNAQVTINQNTADLGTYPGSFVDSGFNVPLTSWASDWHQITVVGEGDETKFYIDGILAGTTAGQASGKFNTVGNVLSGNEQFASYLDEVYLFDEPFSSGQVQQLYDSVNAPIGGIDSGLVDLGGNIYFVADDKSGRGNELWRVPVGSGDAEFVRDFFPGPAGLDPKSLTAYRDKLYFSATVIGFEGNELWRYDPATNEIESVANVNPTGSSFPDELVVAGDYLYFTADTGDGLRHLMRYDGSAVSLVDDLGLNEFSGTVAYGEDVFYFKKVPADLLPRQLVHYNAANNFAYVIEGKQIADDHSSLRERSDGTANLQNVLYSLGITNHVAAPNMLLSARRAGDVNGDGLDDILVPQFSERPVIAAPQLELGGIPLIQPLFSRRYAAPGNATANYSGAELGDVNRDGYDDVVLWSEDTASLFWGSTDSTEIKLLPVSTADATYVRTGNTIIDATAGDFDHDGLGDVAFAVTGNVAEVVVMGNVAAMAPTLNNPTFILPTRQVRRLSQTPGIDFDGDNVDDLLIASPKLDIGSQASVGQIYLVRGVGERERIPSDAKDLANHSVSGSGAYVIDLSSGRPEIFTDSGGLFTTDAGGIWFRFSTLGDGELGDGIIFEAEPYSNGLRAELFDADGRRITGPRQAVDLRTVKAGTYHVRVTSTVSTNFRVLFDAPARGQSHRTTSLPDRDLIRGGDGDDTIQGNFDLDAIFSDSGADTLFAESIEKRDSSPGDTVNAPIPAEHTSVGPMAIDPLADQTIIADPRLSGSFRRAVIKQFGSDTTVGELNSNWIVSDPNNLEVIQNQPIVRSTGPPFTHTMTWKNSIDLSNATNVTLGLRVIRHFYGAGADPLFQTADDWLFHIEFRIGGQWRRVHTEMGDSATAVTIPTLSVPDSNEPFYFRFVYEKGRWGVVDLILTAEVARTTSVPEFAVPIANALGAPVTTAFDGQQRVDQAIHLSDLRSIAALDASVPGVPAVEGFNNHIDFSGSFNTDVIQNRGPTFDFEGGLFNGTKRFVTDDWADNFANGNGLPDNGFFPATSFHPEIQLGYRDDDNGLNAVVLVRQGDDFTFDVNTSAINDLHVFATAGSGNTPIQVMLHYADGTSTTLTSIVPDYLNEITPGGQNFDAVIYYLIDGMDQYGAGHQDINDAAIFGFKFTVDPNKVLEQVTVTKTDGNASNLVVFGATSVGAQNFTPMPDFTKLPNLSSLDLSGRNFADVNLVSSLPNLRELLLERTHVDPNPDTNASLAVLADLDRLTLPVPNLVPGQNLIAREGLEIVFTTTQSGSWTVLNPAGGTAATGTGTSITFTPTGGMYKVTHAATGTFPVFATNVAPVIQGLPPTIALSEGAVRSVEQLLTGVTIQDSGVTTRQVTVTNPAGFVTDLTTGSLDMTDDVIRLDSEIVNEATDLTISFWLKTNAAPHYGTILSAARDGSTNALILATSATSSNELRFFTEAAPVTLTLAAPYNDNQWHHFALVRNDTDDKVSVFMDNHPAVTVNATLNTLLVDSNGLVVGQEQDSVGGNFDPLQSFDGLLDELAIWRRALTAEQIAKIVSDGVVGNEPDLAAYFPLNELGGTVAHDRSPYDRDGLVSSIDASPIAWSADSAIAPKSFVAIDEGDYELVLTAQDSDGASARAESKLIVSNTNPDAVITASVPAEFKVGQTAKFSAMNSSDVGTTDTLAYQWEITSNNGDFVAGSRDETFALTPRLSGRYVIRLTVTDNDGGSSTALDILNVAPTLPNFVNTTGVEGTAITLDASTASAVPVASTRTYSWQVLGTTFAGDQSSFSFIPTDDRDYVVFLSIIDTVGGSTVHGTSTFTTISVANAAPVIDFGATTFANEGDMLFLTPTVTDPGTSDTFTFAWTITDENSQPVLPDGAADQPTVSLTPPDNGVYTVSLTVTDDDGGVTTSQTTIVATNRAPNVQAGNDQTIDEGVANNLIAFPGDSFDPGFNDGPFTFEWDFGDGTTETGSTTNGSLPTSSHTYADSGVYTVTLTVTDKDGGVGVDTSIVTINNLAPTNLSVTGPTLAAEDSRVTFTGTATDLNGTLASAVDVEQLRGKIDFGDGVKLPLLLSRTPSGAAANYTFTSSHIFAQPGSYPVKIEVHDDDGGRSTSSTLTINVTDAVRPTIAATPVSPNPRKTAINDIQINFSEPIVNFERDDLTLKLDGGANLLAGSAATLTDSGNGVWTLGGLAALTTAEGNYALRLDAAASGIVDLGGLPLSGNLGLPWTVDTTAPVVTVDNLTTSTKSPQLTGLINDPAAIIGVTVNGATYPAINMGDGTWRLPANTITALAEATYEVAVVATDAANNQGSDGTMNELTIATLIETRVHIDGSGNLIIEDINNDSSDHLSLRKNGGNLVITDSSTVPLNLETAIVGATGTGTPAVSVPLNLITGGIRVNVGVANNTLADSIVIDYAAGGFFAVPAGIDVGGGNFGGDSLRVTGTGNTQAVYSMAVVPLGQTQLTLTDPGGVDVVRYSQYENRTFNGMQTFAATSTLNVGGGSVSIGSVGPVDLSALTVINGGTLSANLIALDSAETISGNGTIAARVAGKVGSLITANGSLSIGRRTAADGFITEGELRVGTNTVTLLDANQAVLGSLTTLGVGAAQGVLTAPKGFLVDSGNNVTGHGTLSSLNDIAMLTMIKGSVTGNSSTQKITLPGYIGGNGSLDNVNLSGTYSPGLSPAVSVNGSVSYAGNADIIMELAGTEPGRDGHDQVIHTGSAALGGDLTVELMPGFTPVAGDSFVLMTAADGITGDFASVDLPAAPLGSAWDLSVGTNDVRLTLVNLAEVGAVIMTDGDNATQRSSITQIEVQFDRAVDVDAGAFQLSKTGTGGGVVDTAFTLSADAQGNTIATLTFSGTLTRGVKLALVDGNYQLLVDPTKVRSAGTSIAIDGDSDGLQGGAYAIGNVESDAFFAHFGDTDGDRDVDGQDYGRFGLTFLKSQGQAGFNSTLDSDGDGDVDGQDYGRFGQRFLKRLGF